MPTLREIQNATLAARRRTGDDSIGANVKAGRLQVVRVSYPVHMFGCSVVEAMTEHLSAADAISFLEGLS